MNDEIDDIIKKFEDMSDKQLYSYFMQSKEDRSVNMYAIIEGFTRLLHPHDVKTLDFDDVTYLD